MRRELLFSSLLLLGVMGCTSGQEGKSTDNNINTKLEPDLERFLNRSSTFKDIYDRARARNLGLIIVTLENVNYDMWLRFQRIDVAEDERTELDSEISTLTPQQAKNYQIFLATACSGEYQLSMSLDGENYTYLPVPDLSTKVPRETFFLRPSCTRPITVTFEKPNRI